MSECTPTARLLVTSAAVPAETGDVPSDVAPSKNSTEPVAPDGVTVAVSVSGSRKMPGLGLATSETEVPAEFTTCVSTPDVLPP